MRSSERARAAAALLNALAVVARVQEAIDRLRSLEARGYPTGGDNGSSGISDRTGNAALGRPDPHTVAIANIDRCLIASHRVTDELARHITQALTVVDDPGEPGCQSCAQTKTPDGRQRWSEIKYRATTCGSRLEKPASLCDWCYRMICKHDLTGFPTRAQVQDHHRGRPVKWKETTP